jgi:transposase
MKHTSFTTINNFVTLLKQDQGLSTREIANRMGVSQWTVCRIKKEHFPGRKGKKSGRPAKYTTTEIDRAQGDLGST